MLKKSDYLLGHTIINLIKAKINDIDIYEIETKVEYGLDYGEFVSVGQDKVNNNILREIEDLNLSSDDYDTIILETPVWWYTFAPIVHTFLTKYDLTNKKVMPVITNSG